MDNNENLRLCAYCSEPFFATRKEQIHCSLMCRQRYSYVIRKHSVCRCAKCGAEFKSKTKNKYCSRKCQFDKGFRICLNKKCGKKYKAGTFNQKYCCRDCKPYKQDCTVFYQSLEWKQIRTTFVSGFTLISGFWLSNSFCLECYKRGGKLVKMYAVDHILNRKMGGSDLPQNLQSLCKSHHQKKSAIEGNKLRYAKARV